MVQLFFKITTTFRVGIDEIDRLIFANQTASESGLGDYVCQ